MDTGENKFTHFALRHSNRTVTHDYIILSAIYCLEVANEDNKILIEQSSHSEIIAMLLEIIRLKL